MRDEETAMGLDEIVPIVVAEGPARELNAGSFYSASATAYVQRESGDCQIEIRSLGRLMILRDREPLVFGRKVPTKPLALLKMLVASGGVGADIRVLSERLWPESDGDAAKHSFDINLHRLRRIIGIRDLVKLSDGKLSLDHRKCWLDVWEFESIIKRIDAATLASGTRGVRNPTLLNDLLSVYSGHFLEHETQEAWAVSFRDKLRAKFARAVVNLGGCLEQERKWNEAAALYSRALELDNLAEPLYRRLMICYRELDEMAAAIPAALLEKICIIDAPGNIGKRIRARYDGVLDRVALYRSMGGDGEFGRWRELIDAVHA